MLINRLVRSFVMKRWMSHKNVGFKSNLLLLTLFFTVLSINAQHSFDFEVKKSPHFFYNHPNSSGVIEKDHAMARSSSGDAYYLMNLRKSVGAINELIKITKDEYWIGENKQIVDNLISTAQVSANIPNNTRYFDHFKGWISLNEQKSYLKEVPLYESYTFLYVTEFLYILDQIGWTHRSSENTLWWEQALEFVETNIWTKWAVRSKATKGNIYWNFLRGRTHMGSHWAGTAMYLGAITSNHEIQTQTQVVVNQFDTLLKRNFIEVEGGYIWNSSYDDVEGTYASSSTTDIIQDVSHGNHVLAYVVAAHEFGNPKWQTSDIQRLVYTMKNFMYDEETLTFSDNVDGTAGSSRQGWGNFIGDGWVKLAVYDENLKVILDTFTETNMLKRYNQEFQYKANMYKFKLTDAQD